MGKKILGVILGYVIMFVVVFVGLTIAYLAMGSDGAFETGSYEPTKLWNFVMLGVGIVAAIAGGAFCGKLTNSMGAVYSLAMLVLVLGAISAGLMLTGDKEDPGPRTGDVGNFQAMTRAQPPVWTTIANPIIGVAGVLVGASLVGTKEGGAKPGGAAPSE